MKIYIVMNIRTHSIVRCYEKLEDACSEVYMNDSNDDPLGIFISWIKMEVKK